MTSIQISGCDDLPRENATRFQQGSQRVAIFGRRVFSSDLSEPPASRPKQTRTRVEGSPSRTIGSKDDVVLLRSPPPWADDNPLHNTNRTQKEIHLHSSCIESEHQVSPNCSCFPLGCERRQLLGAPTTNPGVIRPPHPSIVYAGAEPERENRHQIRGDTSRKRKTNYNPLAGHG